MIFGYSYLNKLNFVMIYKHRSRGQRTLNKYFSTFYFMFFFLMKNMDNKNIYNITKIMLYKS